MYIFYFHVSFLSPMSRCINFGSMEYLMRICMFVCMYVYICVCACVRACVCTYGVWVYVSVSKEA
jgi:hypothetical protein